MQYLHVKYLFYFILDNGGEKNTYIYEDSSKIKQGPEQKSKKLKENVKTPDITSQNILFPESKYEANVDKPQKTIKSQHSPMSDIKSSQFPVRNALSNINISNISQLNLELTDHKSKTEQNYANVSNNNTDSQETAKSGSKMDKDSGTLSRKSYLSFKSKFKRNSSLTESNKSRSQSLSVMNSTFYLNELLNDSTEDKR